MKFASLIVDVSGIVIIDEVCQDWVIIPIRVVTFLPFVWIQGLLIVGRPVVAIVRDSFDNVKTFLILIPGTGSFSRIFWNILPFGFRT